jgi:tetratricopeptide (TPR) repeat protein
MKRFALTPLLLLAACHKPAPEAPPPAPEAETTTGKHALALRDPVDHGRVDEALRKAQAALGHNAANADFWIRVGQLWVRKAREASDPVYYASAEAAAEAALELSPDFSPALDLRGLVLLNEHKFTEARDLAQATLSRRPDDILAHGVLSDANLELGNYEAAVTAAQGMVDLKPNLPSYSRAAHLMWLRGDVKGARETWRLAIDSGMDLRDMEPRAWVIVQAALLFLGQGDLAGAEAGFKQALIAVPHYPPALVGAGRIALARHEGAKAVALFDEAYAASPLLETLWLLGDARAMAGDTAAAEEAYAKLVKQGAQTDPRTLSLFLSTKSRDPARAVELAMKEKKARDDLWTEDALAWALYRSGKLPEARAASDAATRLGTPDARLLFHAGAIRLAAGDASGKALVQRALALNPAFDVTGASEAKALLER